MCRGISYPDSRQVSKTKMASTFDQELRKAFQELQLKAQESTQRIRYSEVQIDQLKRSIAHATLTEKELGTLPAGTKTYESVGRMFVLEPIPVLRQDIKEKIKSQEEKIQTLEANKEYLQKSVKEHEDNIREMLAHRP